jgi:pyruvate/2-oxoglutarate/acetoin dehydrogenase E1 component/TPP-dependent pyruvate/acetoin dehydrogenase alpha subunit
MYLDKPEIETTGEVSLSEILNDYYTAYLSRQLSLLGRREVHNGRAHFGIFGDGKEVAQIAYARQFRKGDWRSGYYRDQTFMLYLGLLQPEEFFSMIYGDTDESINPSTVGRNFNNHFSTPNISRDGEIRDLSERYNSASDISPTAGQMPRLLGLAQASKMVRENPDLIPFLNNNISGNEVSFGSIGDASTSEGIFFETINAAGVMRVPLAIAVYDDGFGISVPIELQTTKSSISKVLEGFRIEKNSNGIEILNAKGWDYPGLIKIFKQGISLCRQKHVPVIFHITEVTQPLGHSTSGSHERYKTSDRLNWEKEYDCIIQFRKWLLETGKADKAKINDIEKKAEKRARAARDAAWKIYLGGFTSEVNELTDIVEKLKGTSTDVPDSIVDLENIKAKLFPTRRSFLSFAKRLLFELQGEKQFEQVYEQLKNWIKAFEIRSGIMYNSSLYIEGKGSVLNIVEKKPVYSDDAQEVNGSEILNRNFDVLFSKYPTLVTFGQDTGKLGDVNQGMKGMQEKYGIDRIGDAGIREATILGQGIGLALRGFRPIAEIQYLDYLIYALSQISDDLASLQYRTNGKQAAPLIIRTRGHQLQGIWHAGSPMQMLLGSMRGINICVPRNMVQAAGMYNTLLEAMEPALVIEPLKAYNVKEKLPSNSGEFKIPLGVPEIIRSGSDITVVTYAWNVNHALKSAELAMKLKGISVEVIDIQTLIPFDIDYRILGSVKKTGKIIFLDEDVPGGATAYMMQKVLEEQKAYDWLDAAPRTVTGKDHRPAYGIDGEYFSKPNVWQIYETIYEVMSDANRSLRSNN